MLFRPFPIVNVIADQSGAAVGDVAALQSVRQAERVRASTVAKSIADQRESAQNIAVEAAPLLDRLSKLASSVGAGSQLQNGGA